MPSADGLQPSFRSSGGSPPVPIRAGVRLLLAAFLLVEPAPTFADASRVYSDADACRSAHALDDAECLTAYANAKAEFDEKAPRFPTRSDCQRHFERCMIAEIGPRGVTFMPAMRGFRIDSGRQRRVAPVAEGGEAAALFQPRAVDRVDSFVSPARRAQAQDAWKAMTSPDAAAEDAMGLRLEDGLDEWPPSGDPQSAPVPPAMLQDLRNRERLFGIAPKP
jgi:hypothetical protein